MKHGDISRLARQAQIRVQTFWRYYRGLNRPSYDIAQRLAKETGHGTDSEILAWLSKDPAQIAPLVEDWAARQ